VETVTRDRTRRRPTTGDRRPAREFALTSPQDDAPNDRTPRDEAPADGVPLDGPAADPQLAALIARAGAHGRTPPVERWDPPFCGDIDMKISADGVWHYAGSPIGREPLVRLFSTVLRRDADGRYLLVTPVEKLGITVEDVPFLAVEMHAEGDGDTARLVFRTNVGDVVTAGPERPLRFVDDPANGGLVPYVLVRGRLEARLTRALAHELASRAVTTVVDGTEQLGVWSDGAFFPMMTADALKSALA
jgi:hypothetical protein